MSSGDKPDDGETRPLLYGVPVPRTEAVGFMTGAGVVMAVGDFGTVPGALASIVALIPPAAEWATAVLSTRLTRRRAERVARGVEIAAEELAARAEQAHPNSLKSPAASDLLFHASQTMAEAIEPERVEMAARAVMRLLTAEAPVEYRDALHLLRLARELHHDHLQVLSVLAKGAPLTSSDVAISLQAAVSFATGISLDRIGDVIAHDLVREGLTRDFTQGHMAIARISPGHLLTARGRDFMKFALGVDVPPPLA